MAVPLPIDLAGALASVLAFMGISLVAVLALLAAPRVVGRLRQSGYDRAVAGERVRLEIRPPAGTEISADALVALIRGLHPRHRRGVDPVRVGWPTIELSTVAFGGRLAWEIVVPQMHVPPVTVALRTAIPDIEIAEVAPDDGPATAMALGLLTATSSWPLAASDDAATGVPARLATALGMARADAIVRYRLRLRPLRSETWRAVVEPDAVARSTLELVGQATLEALLFRRTRSAAAERPTATPAEREAASRKRAGVVGFAVGIAIEVGGIPEPDAVALLHRLTPAVDAAGTAHQSIAWRIGRGSIGPEPVGALADWEVAALWSPPIGPVDRMVRRERPLAAPAPTGDHGLVIAYNGDRAVTLQADMLMRHLAVIGATGSGKSTLLLTLLTEAIRTGLGATLIDPHGDLVDDVLARVPDSDADRVSVLRLADRAHPRGFNILERRTPDEAQLVTSEFVDMLEDLWPRFCGPKMQHYLRHALLTLLDSPEPATVLELVRILTDDDFRQPYVDSLRDPLLRAFWANEWPGRRERERDTSIKAVLNKLGAFVAYEQIRMVVGQGTSTVRPRIVMDQGRVLLVDLSRVGGDNASLFGAMAISRCYVDAVGRQGTPLATRRPHVLVVDEAQRFDTRSLGRIAVEGRKFGLGLVLASQSLAGLGERLRGTVLTNAASLAMLAPGQDDVRSIGRLFSPVTPERLSDLRRFEVVLRTPGEDGHPAVVGGVVRRSEEEERARVSRITADSDRRDARPPDAVRREVHRRSGGDRVRPVARAATAADDR